MTCHELEQFLYPYLDGEFEPDERFELERHLAECQVCAQRVHQESRFLQTLRVKAREAAQAPASLAPASLRHRVSSGLRREQRRARYAALTRLSAAALVVLVTGGTYWFLRTPSRQRFLDDATHWYSKRLPHESRPDTHEQAEAWFGDKLDHRVDVPRFHNARIEGVRITHVSDRPAAYIGYEAAKSSGSRGRVGVFVFNDRERVVDAEDAPSVVSNRGYHVALWRKGEIVYEMVSDLDEADIRRMLERLYAPPAHVPQAPAAPMIVEPAGSSPIGIQPASYQQGR